MKILEKLLNYCGKEIPSIIKNICQTGNIVFKYLTLSKEIKQKKDEEKKKKELKKTIDELADKGKLSDLLSIVSALTIVFFSCSGCSSNDIVNVTTTNQWEGHYYNEKDAQAAISSINLKRNESIWIFSNTTLKKILIKENKQ